MTRCKVALLAVSVVILAFGAAYGQNELSDFPVGTTEMTYRITTADLPDPQTLELTVTGLPDGRYRVRMTAESTGTPDQLSLFGFMFGMTTVRSGGTDIDFGPISALLSHRDVLAVGEDYVLPGGGSFHATAEQDIAGIPCLIGTYTDPDHPNTRTTLAFSREKPVFIAPLIKVEERHGSGWEVTFLLELTSYSVTEG